MTESLAAVARPGIARITPRKTRVGLVAGGVVGYTAGPSIASNWGLKKHAHHRHQMHASNHS